MIQRAGPVRQLEHDGFGALMEMTWLARQARGCDA